MGSSIAAGVAALDADVIGCLIVPGDVGLLPPVLVVRPRHGFPGPQARLHRLSDGRRRAAQSGAVAAPAFQCPAGAAADKGAKALLQLVASECVPVVVDAAAISDIDTPADLEAARKLAGG